MESALWLGGLVLASIFGLSGEGQWVRSARSFVAAAERWSQPLRHAQSFAALALLAVRHHRYLSLTFEPIMRAWRRFWFPLRALRDVTAVRD
jgi:hypothetical protein